MKRYKVADIFFDVILPQGEDHGRLLPSFAPFETTGEGEGFVFDATADPLLPSDAECVATDSNDMGHTSLYRSETKPGYTVFVEFEGARAIMYVDRDFTRAEASLDFADELAPSLLTSLLRIMFSLTAIKFDAVSVHSSTVVYDGKGYMFMGTSGTGKSTHSEQWIKAFPGCRLLNDDNPIIRITGDTLMVYGSPWSGKTPCYRNASAPVGGIARLEQAPENIFTRIEDVQAFVEVYKGCSVLRSDDRMHDRLCDIIGEAVEMVPVGHLRCRPDTEAAAVCLEGFENHEENE